MAVSVSAPCASAPAAMLMVALPLVSVVADEVYPPPERMTLPVGVPLELLTATVTESGWPTVMLLAPGVTVTVGVNFGVTVTVFEPDAEL